MIGQQLMENLNRSNPRFPLNTIRSGDLKVSYNVDRKEALKRQTKVSQVLFTKSKKIA